MQTETITALIGALGTIVAAALGAYATVQAGKAPPTTGIKRPKAPWILLSIGFVFSLLILGVGIGLGRSQTARREVIEKEAKVNESLKSYRDLVEAGLRADKKYIIPAAAMVVDLERSSDGNSIESTRRITYMTQMLSDIEENDRDFIEGYHSMVPIYRVPGSDDERMVEKNTPTMKTWEVRFNAVNGSRHTIVTGAFAQMPFSFTEDHDQHQFEGLKSNEDAYCYPNDAADIIEEMVIVIESRTLNLYLRDGTDNASLLHNNTVTPVEATLKSVDDNGGHHRVIAARFKNLQKDDVAGVRVAWQQ